MKRKHARVSPPAAASAASSVGALFGTAVALHRQGRMAEAEAGYRATLRADPGHPDAANNLAILLRHVDRHEEALGFYRLALARAADPASVRSNLGCLLLGMKRTADAVAQFRAAIALRPAYAEAYFNLADALQREKDEDGALRAYATALRIKPDLAEAHSNLGSLLKGRGELERACAAFTEALRLNPRLTPAYCNLGETLKEQGRITEAILVFQKGLEVDPGNVLIHSNLLFALNYTPEAPVDLAFRAHAGWGQRHADPLLPTGRTHANPRDPDRRLRVGYVSPDFVTHSVSFFVEPLLREHDRTAVEVFCYAEERTVDITTDRLRRMADHWRPIRGVDDDAVAARIEADGIDILVDLAGHTADHRLLVFARKPAPVQATWLGYPNTTGMRAIDYRFTDPLAEPEDGPHTPGRETPVRLPNGFHCYQPPFFAPACDPPPALTAGRVTFGSFNNLSKVTPAVVRVWAEILRRAPEARLLIKARALADPPTRDRYRALFAAHGVEAERLDLLARIEPAQSHMAAYGRIDVALDPFPYNGTTTTCEALWMGVPVVTLAGITQVGRVGVSLLTRCGLERLVAQDEAAYVEAALALAADLEGLAALRAGMRDRLARSSLCDAPGFARQVEAAYRAMWRAWLARADA